MPINADMQCVYGCVGSLGVLSGILGFRMSLFRVAGSPGEADPESDLNKWYLANMLHSEWAPVGAGLALALVAKGTAQKSAAARNCVAIFATSRWIFTLAVLFCDKIAIKMPAMMSMYGTVFAMGGMLLIPSY
jgi:hypothetical protein